MLSAERKCRAIVRLLSQAARAGVMRVDPAAASRPSAEAGLQRDPGQIVLVASAILSTVGMEKRRLHEPGSAGGAVARAAAMASRSVHPM